MLVLSRRLKQKLLIPDLGISIQVLLATSGKFKIGIDAPPEIRIVREELHEASGESEHYSPLAAANEVEALVTRIKSLAAKNRGFATTAQKAQTRAALAALIQLANSLRKAGTAHQTDFQLTSCDVSKAGKGHALLVEDNSNEAKLLAGYLRCRDIRVDIADDGAEALEYLEGNGLPDWILLDMNLPRYDGRWTVGKIRSNPRFREAHLIAVTGSPPDECGVHVGPQGVDHWFRKPLDPELLACQLVDSISKREPVASN